MNSFPSYVWDCILILLVYIIQSFCRIKPFRFSKMMLDANAAQCSDDSNLLQGQITSVQFLYLSLNKSSLICSCGLCMCVHLHVYCPYILHVLFPTMYSTPMRVQLHQKLASVDSLLSHVGLARRLNFERDPLEQNSGTLSQKHNKRQRNIFLYFRSNVI